MRVAMLMWVMCVVPLLGAEPPQSKEPTPEQLQAAKEAFAKIGGVLLISRNGQKPQFEMLRQSKDEDLKKIPEVPFLFGLSLAGTQVTDAGIKEISNIKNLTSLNLLGTKVTGAEMRQLLNLKHLTAVTLSLTKVTCGMRKSPHSRI